MHNWYTDLLLDLPEVRTLQVLEIDEQTVHIEASPVLTRRLARSAKPQIS